MEEQITLNNKSRKGIPLQAILAPNKGMQLVLLKWANHEIRDCAKIIGPHFAMRNPAVLPNESKTESGDDRYPFGLGRYARWNYEVKDQKIFASISGKETLGNLSLQALQGQNFEMNCNITLKEEELLYELSIVSETDSLIGLECIFPIETGSESIKSDVKEKFYSSNELQTVPKEWKTDFPGFFKYSIQNSADFAFHPFFNPLKGAILYETPYYQIHTKYESLSQELSWHLYYPSNSKSVCISPVSSQNPWRPNLTVSSICVSISLEL